MKIRRLKSILRQRGYTCRSGKGIYIWMHHSVLTVHDEIVLECPDAQIEAATQILKGAMVQACREYLKVVHIPEPDVLVGSYWKKD